MISREVLTLTLEDGQTFEMIRETETNENGVVIRCETVAGEDAPTFRPAPGEDVSGWKLNKTVKSKKLTAKHLARLAEKKLRP